MCSNSRDWINPSARPIYASSKRKHRSSRLQIYRLSRRRCEDEYSEMELKNLKLYLENQSIIEENQKLRQKANLLHQENLALMSKFQNNHLHPFSVSLFLLLKKQ